MFNYEKGFFTLAKPVIDNLTSQEKKDIARLAALVTDRHQKRDLNISTEGTKEIFADYTCQRLAELSRACYFVTHWKPGGVQPVGVLGGCPGWKIANVLDQILRERLSVPRKIEIHEGVFRVTFSNRDCWLWDEFGLATEQNLETFKTCGLPFGEETISESARKLAKMIGDIWPYPDDMPDNKEYLDYLKIKREKALQAQLNNAKKQLKDIDKKIAHLKKEHYARRVFLEETALPLRHLSNLIHYTHKDEFTFGWDKPLTIQEKENIQAIIAGCDDLQGFKFTFKTA